MYSGIANSCLQLHSLRYSIKMNTLYSLATFLFLYTPDFTDALGSSKGKFSSSIYNPRTIWGAKRSWYIDETDGSDFQTGHHDKSEYIRRPGRPVYDSSNDGAHGGNSENNQGVLRQYGAGGEGPVDEGLHGSSSEYQEDSYNHRRPRPAAERNIKGESGSGRQRMQSATDSPNNPIVDEYEQPDFNTEGHDEVPLENTREIQTRRGGKMPQDHYRQAAHDFIKMEREKHPFHNKQRPPHSDFNAPLPKQGYPQYRPRPSDILPDTNPSNTDYNSGKRPIPGKIPFNTKYQSQLEKEQLHRPDGFTGNIQPYHHTYKHQQGMGKRTEKDNI